MIRLTLLMFALALSTAACGGSAPATPSVVAAANLVSVGQGSWTQCNMETCVFLASIQNTGPGCATGAEVTVTISNSAAVPIGEPNTHMGVQGTTGLLALSTRVIQPNEVVALSSTIPLAVAVKDGMATYQLFPKWTSVKC
jgi:hypothetical protein